MELANIEICVPKEMKTFLSNENSVDELRRNALILYPYIKDLTISHGRAAEILGIPKWDLIELYESMGLPYLDLDISEVEKEINSYYQLQGVKA
ncbi:MAG: UPF0175 family protein [Roseburia sp.]|nr:UPF0175 family protein [Roseburia sp.]